MFDFREFGRARLRARRSWYGHHREQAMFRATRRRWTIGWGELRLMVLGGIALGLVGVQFWDRRAELVQFSLSSSAGSADTASARFGLCHAGGGTNCVVDGDTFWFRGERVRIADIDTPETHPPRCAAEAELGARATQRLHALLNQGPFTLESIDRDTDRYGRKLRRVTRGGDSIGGMLVGEGLARRYGGGMRAGWC
ncbi:MAG: thermonuclease family protein [Sphingomonadaceae bacterium]